MCIRQGTKTIRTCSSLVTAISTAAGSVRSGRGDADAGASGVWRQRRRWVGLYDSTENDVWDHSTDYTSNRRPVFETVVACINDGHSICTRRKGEVR